MPCDTSLSTLTGLLYPASAQPHGMAAPAPAAQPEAAAGGGGHLDSMPSWGVAGLVAAPSLALQPSADLNCLFGAADLPMPDAGPPSKQQSGTGDDWLAWDGWKVRRPCTLCGLLLPCWLGAAGVMRTGGTQLGAAWAGAHVYPAWAQPGPCGAAWVCPRRMPPLSGRFPATLPPHLRPIACSSPACARDCCELPAGGRRSPGWHRLPPLPHCAARLHTRLHTTPAARTPRQHPATQRTPHHLPERSMPLSPGSR